MSGLSGSGTDIYARARLRFPLTVSGINALVSSGLPSGFQTLTNMLAFLFKAPAGNTGAMTLDIGDGTARAIVDQYGNALAPGAVFTGMMVEVVYDQASNSFFAPISVLPRNRLSGFTMSTAGASATMTVAAGQATDSTNAVMMSIASALGKTTAAWAVGNNQGGKLSAAAIAPSTWYYFYAIRRPDTGVVDIGFDVSSSTPTLPINYTQYRYIGAGLTDGSSNWTAFTQMGREFFFVTPPLDVSSAGTGTAGVLATLSVPRGRKVKAFINAAAQQQIYISDPNNADMPPQVSASPLLSISNGQGGSTSVWTNLSAQIRYRCNVSGWLYVATLGWLDLADTQ